MISDIFCFAVAKRYGKYMEIIITKCSKTTGKEKWKKKESADAQKHNLDFVCIKYDFIPHPIHKTNQIYQTIKQSNFDSVFAHYLICCHIPHTHISLLIKNDA